MNVKMWNKKDSINGVSSDIVLERNPLFRDNDVFLIANDDNIIYEMQICSIIKDQYNLSKSLTSEEIAQKYLEIKEEEKQKTEEDVITLENQEKKISILEAENKILKQELSITQDAVNELIFNSLNI